MRSRRYSPLYKGMVGVISTMDADSLFLVMIDVMESKFSFYSAASYVASTSFLSEEGTMKEIHALMYSSLKCIPTSRITPHTSIFYVDQGNKSNGGRRLW